MLGDILLGISWNHLVSLHALHHLSTYPLWSNGVLFRVNSLFMALFKMFASARCSSPSNSYLFICLLCKSYQGTRTIMQKAHKREREKTTKTYKKKQKIGVVRRAQRVQVRATKQIRSVARSASFCYMHCAQNALEHTTSRLKANSAFHPAGVGKWVPASAGKAKAGMVHSVSGWTRGVQVKLWDPLITSAILERLRGVFTTRRYANPRLSLHLKNSQILCVFVRGKAGTERA